MYSKTFLKIIIALLGFLSLHHQAFVSSRRLSLHPEDDDDVAPDGVCSAAVSVHGYKCQEYNVTTDDGYILSVQNIPQGRAGSPGPNRPPVLLQHGVLVDGMTWVLNSPEQSLAMILADNGFDVWISNIRGTQFSRRHLQLDPDDDDEFWDWTWDDLVIHDLPSVTAFVVNQTGQKMHYIGHSMGTLIALASLSEGNLTDKVRSAALLSPIAYLSHMTTDIGNIGAKAFLGEIAHMFGLAEFDPQDQAADDFVNVLRLATGIDWNDLSSDLTGSNCCLNSSTADFFLKNELQSTSTKNLVHFSQTVRDGVVSKYDYGSDESNSEHYGESSPPVYDLSKIPHDFPLFLSYGGEDALSDVKDVATLLDALKNHDVDKLHVQYIEDFAHLDFIIGITAKDVVYNKDKDKIVIFEARNLIPEDISRIVRKRTSFLRRRGASMEDVARGVFFLVSGDSGLYQGIIWSFLKIIALLGFLSLHHQAFVSSRRLSLHPADGNDDVAPDGVCSAAVSVHGYKCQEYNVTTDDGYILSVQNIPQGRAGSPGPNRPPVLLQHGILVDGMTWVLNSPEQSLAMILADNGFDVWISNIRGTRFSRRHLQLDPDDDDEFWDWTWDDLVIHDLPSVTAFVFNQTGQKIHYIGHSMGTLIALASLSEGNLTDKVRSAALLSPIAYLSHMTTDIGNMGAKAFLGEITDVFGLAEFDPKGQPVYDFVNVLRLATGIDWNGLMSDLAGSNCCLNSSTSDFFLKNELQSTSTKNLVHFSQTVRDGVVSKYDYGSDESNSEHYGESSPPDYDLSKIPHDFPLFLSYGGEDALSDVKDVATLLDDLKNHDVDKLHVQYIEDFAHLDFIIGITARDVVYNKFRAFCFGYIVGYFSLSFIIFLKHQNVTISNAFLPIKDKDKIVIFDARNLIVNVNVM
ncbi:lipase, partial [Striga asiatica]